MGSNEEKAFLLKVKGEDALTLLTVVSPTPIFMGNARDFECVGYSTRDSIGESKLEQQLLKIFKRIEVACDPKTPPEVQKEEIKALNEVFSITITKREAESVEEELEERDSLSIENEGERDFDAEKLEPVRDQLRKIMYDLKEIEP